jgi:hypothetical protein
VRLSRLGFVRRGSKTLVAALAAMLLAAGLVACGSDDDSSSTTTAQERSPAGASPGSGAKGDAEAKPAGPGEADGGSGQAGGGDPSDFVPKQHQDSGGGSGQYRVQGGDNSVQEFGEEAGASEFEAAAAALHDFLDARAEGNWAAACEYMARSTVESFERLAAQATQIEDKSCGGILEKLTNPAAKQALKVEAEKADVGSLRTEGDRSFVIYTGAEGTILAIPMAREGGTWKVASLTSTPLN